MSDMSSSKLRLATANRPRSLGQLAWHLLRRMMDSLAREPFTGRLLVIAPDGALLEHHGALAGPRAAIVLHSWGALRRMLLDGQAGLADAFIAGEWSTPDLAALIELGARNRDALHRLDGAWLPRVLASLTHRLHANTRRGSRRNIAAHYDLGNDFYAAWLDAGMSYSAALYPHAAATLEEAQSAKQARVMQLLQCAPGQRILEIGSGWGGLAERLADEQQCDVTGLTLSHEQHALSVRRIERAGLQDRARFLLQDYRDEGGQYDRIVSIEMFEAVGEANWAEYFRTIKRSLRPSGVALLQVITIDECRFGSYRRNADFIQRHIFPGGMLPSRQKLHEQIGASGMLLDHEERFGQDYARTLADWAQRFCAAWPTLRLDPRFGERFRRKWEYYLAYCEGGFRAGALDVGLYRIRADPRIAA